MSFGKVRNNMLKEDGTKACGTYVLACIAFDTHGKSRGNDHELFLKSLLKAANNREIIRTSEIQFILNS